jgi:hypothetical protein
VGGEALRELSRAYVGQLAISDAVDCPPPYKVLGRVARLWWTTRSTSCSGDRVIAGTLEIQMMDEHRPPDAGRAGGEGHAHRALRAMSSAWPGR